MRLDVFDDEDVVVVVVVAGARIILDADVGAGDHVACRRRAPGRNGQVALVVVDLVADVGVALVGRRIAPRDIGRAAVDRDVETERRARVDRAARDTEPAPGARVSRLADGLIVLVILREEVGLVLASRPMEAEPRHVVLLQEGGDLDDLDRLRAVEPLQVRHQHFVADGLDGAAAGEFALRHVGGVAESLDDLCDRRLRAVLGELLRQAGKLDHLDALA